MNCADLARRHDEPLAGTAPTAVGWWCVEQPGAWGRDAATESGLDPALGAALQARVEDLPVRLQLIRRPHRPRSSAPTVRVLLAHAGETSWLEELELDDVAELSSIDPEVCTRPAPPGLGEPVTGERYLVCTHARRDRCCATFGRPVADTLAALHPEATWDVSHVGGHRFAGNLLVLPYGLVFGGLQVVDAVRVVDRLAVRRLELPSLRGRSSLSRPAQAAEVLVRRALGEDRVDAVRVRAVEEAGASAVVTLDVDGRVLLARVGRRPLGAAFALSCDAEGDEDPGVWDLTGLEAD